jgi:hypothetical protein
LGRIGRLLSFTRRIFNGANLSESKLDGGGGANITGEHFSAPGDDAFPLAGDYVATVGISRRGGEIVVGYLDPKNAGVAASGEKRIYSRDSAGAAIASIHLFSSGAVSTANASGVINLGADGTVTMSNNAGSIILSASGVVFINGLTIGTDGALISPASVAAPSMLANSKEISNHIHPAGIPPGNTGVNT